MTPVFFIISANPYEVTNDECIPAELFYKSQTLAGFKFYRNFLLPPFRRFYKPTAGRSGRQTDI